MRTSTVFYIPLDAQGWRTTDAPLEVVGVVAIAGTESVEQRLHYRLKQDDGAEIVRPFEPIDGDPDRGYAMVPQEALDDESMLPPTHGLTAADASVFNGGIFSKDALLAG